MRRTVTTLLALSTLTPGCKFIFEPKVEPRYRWVVADPVRGGGRWVVDPAGTYVWAGKDFKHVASLPESFEMSKRWR